MNYYNVYAPFFNETNIYMCVPVLINWICLLWLSTGVKKHILRLPVTSVPDSVTTYMCMKFKLPTDGDYHIIAEEPVIDNDHVVHHMIMFGCQDLGNYKLHLIVVIAKLLFIYIN